MNGPAGSWEDAVPAVPDDDARGAATRQDLAVSDRHRLEPLSRHRIVRSSVVDEVRDVVPRFYSPHQTVILERNPRLRAVLNGVALSDVTVGYLSYGTEIQMIPEPLTSCYHINVPTTGYTRSSSGRTSITSSPGSAAVFSPGLPITIRWSPDCAQLAVKLSREALQNELNNLLAHEASPLRFELAMDLMAPAGQTWLDTLELVLAQVERAESVIHQPLAGASFERLLMTTLLFAQPHNHSDALNRPVPPLGPSAVQHVMDLMNASPEVPYTAGDLAAHAGVSLRALQAGFRRHLGVSPMAYLNDVRLQRVHAELAGARPGDVTATEVAYRWGFAHLGRFSAAYRKRFGVSPSETLRRRDLPPPHARSGYQSTQSG